MEVENPDVDLRALGRERHQAQQAPLGQAQPLLVANRLRALMVRPDQWTQALKIQVGTACGLFLLAVIAIFASLGSLSPLEYGLKYSTFSKKIDETYVYQGGRHMIGPFSSFVTFPATVQNIEFSLSPNATAAPLSTRTQEGLALTLHISFQYHLDRNQIPALYHSTNVHYESLFVKIAREGLQYGASQYKAVMYWQERQRIAKEMFDTINNGLNSSHAICSGLQLLRIDLPPQFEDKIVQTQVAQQSVKTKQNEQKAALVRAQIGVMIAKYTKNATITVANATANATLTKQKADAKAAQMRIDAEAGAFRDVSDSLGLSNDELVTYQKNFAYMNIPNSQFFFGVENPMTVVGSLSSHAADSAAQHLAQGLQTGAAQMVQVPTSTPRDYLKRSQEL